MAMFDDNLSSGEDLDNTGNDNEVDGDVDESSSDKGEIKKILKIGKKEVNEFNGRTKM